MTSTQRSFLSRHMPVVPRVLPRALPLVAAACMAVLCASPVRAQSQEPSPAPAPGFWQDVRMSVAAKLWVNEWASWVGQDRDDGAGHTLTDFTTISGHRTAVIPAVSARWHDWLVSGSAFAASRYALSGSGVTVHTARHESDVSIGHYVLPTVAVSAGWKTVRQVFGDQYHFAGPALGISGSAPLPGSPFAVYGSFAQGVFRATFGLPDASGRTVFRARYNLSEFGFAYAQGRSSLVPADLTWTVGYRQQSIVTLGYRGRAASGTFEDKVRDTTQGLTLGMVLSY